MSDIQVEFIGEDAQAVQEQFERLIRQYIGDDTMIQGATVAGGMLKTVTAVTLVITLSTLFAAPKGILAQLAAKSRQEAFLKHLQQFIRDYNVELIFTLPDGRRIDFRTVSIDEVRELLNRRFSSQ